LKKIIIIFCICILIQPSKAADTQVFLLSKLITQVFNEENPRSLINLVDDLDSEASEINEKDKKAFLRKASQIFLKQQKISKGLQKITGTQSNTKNLKELLLKLKSFNYRSRSIRFDEKEIRNRQNSINTLIQATMSDLEDDIETAKQKLLKEPYSSGLFGLTEEISGDCMPTIEKTPTSCTHVTKSIELAIRRPANLENFDSSGALVKKTELISKIKSDERGFFEINLSPGAYSILAIDGDREICSSAASGSKLACSIELEAGSKAFYKLVLDKALW